MTIATINNVNFQDKRVIVRLDLNLPLHNGRIIDNTRIERILTTLKN